MDRQILNITANEQILTCDNPIKISTNKVNYIEVHFTLGDNWSGYDSVRAVWFNDFYCISTVLDSNGVAFVPSEVMKRNGKVKVNLVGSISENDVLTDRLTSYPIVAVIVDCTAQINGAETAPITPSQFEQYVAIVRGLVDSVKDIDHIELNSDYTLTIYYSDGTSDTTGSVRGADGNGIESVTKTGTSGLVDTYTITFTDGQTTAFNVTNGAKGDTGNGISSIEKTSTVGLVDTYTITYTNGTTTTFTVTNGEKGDKGDTGDVSLSELEDATIVQTLSDTEPYNFRRTNNGLGAGVREYDKIVGASVGWNQLSPIITDYSAYLGTKSVSDNVLTFTATASTTSGAQVYKSVNTPLPANHKYLSLVQIRPSKAVEIRLTYYGSTVRFVPSKVMTANVWNLYSGITETASNTTQLTFYTNINSALSEGDTVEYKDFMVVDLTLFNSAIADYVYTLEQSTAGSGVTWLKTHFPKLFDNGYQPYDSGSIKSVSGLTAHEMVGKNLFDISLDKDTESTTITPTVPITEPITISAVNNNVVVSSAVWRMSVYYKSGDVERVGDMGFWGGTFPKTFTSTPSNPITSISYRGANITSGSYDIQVEFGSTATDYTEYESHTYPLDSSVTLRGQYKINNGQLYAVGDVYKSSGEVGRTWSEIDLGTKNWLYLASDDAFFTTIADIDRGNGCVCSKYPWDTRGVSTMSDKAISLASGGVTSVWIKDTSFAGDVTAFKASLSGVAFVYAKTTSSTEQATPYTSPQWCDSHGTEEYVGSELPVGHNTDYPMTLIDTADGLSNGTYEPRITVANGKKTVTWVSV